MKTKGFGGFKHGAALLWKYSIWVKKDLKEQVMLRDDRTGTVESRRCHLTRCYLYSS